MVGLREVKSGIGKTYEADENLVTWLDVDVATVLVDGHVLLRFAVRAENSVDTDGFHAVAEELLVRFFRVFFGEAVDLGEVLLALLGQVVVNDLGEL